MLYHFLESHRLEILALAEEKTTALAGALSSSSELKRALPVFYENLIAYLKAVDHGSAQSEITFAAAQHGRELLRLHYSLSHVVHAYGSMCQAITELAQRRGAQISAGSFNDLNMCLDLAIAAAVSEFQYRSVQASESKEVQHLGALVHELRNALTSATVAHDMISKGLVGNGGSTAKVLAHNLVTMRTLIDRSLSEVRMRADPELHTETFSVADLVNQILLTAQNDADQKNIVLANHVGSEIEVETDRQLLLSAMANLIQNAIKYSKEKGHVTISGKFSAGNVVIEVEDECGGLNPDNIKSLFKPFVSGGFDRSGMGLGLTIVQRSVELIQGTISVSNSPGRGCAFRIELATKFIAAKLSKAVPGNASVQPSKPNKI